MKLNEIVTPPAGTYVGTVFDNNTKKELRQLMIDLKIPNRTPSKRLHSTIIYSKKHIPDFETTTEGYPKTATCRKFHIFDTRDGNRALVLILDCQSLVDRHNEIMQNSDATYDFPRYIPHITLSYDCADFDPESYKGTFPSIVITGEYAEDLKLDWNDKD
jgi:hypothetical protein